MAARLTAEASRGAQRVAGAVVPAQAAAAVPDSVVAVEMAADEHAEARARAPSRLLGQLQWHALGGDDVVPPHHAFGLDAEDLVEIHAPQGNEGRGGIGRQAAELGVESGEEMVAQVPVGG